MIRLQAIYFSALFLATLILFSSALRLDMAPYPVWMLVPACIWLIGWYVQQRWMLTLTFILFVLLIIVAIYRDYPPLPMIVASLSAYVLWDMELFVTRLRHFDDESAFRTINNRPKLIRQHLVVIGGIIFGSLILSLIILNTTLDIGFWPAIILSTTLAIGLNQAIRYLRESDF